MNETSALYVGTVMHRRIKPRAHKLRYRVFWLLLDLDEIVQLDANLRLFSRKRFNLFSFRNADHGDGSGVPLRQQAERHLAAAGIDLHGGKIRLLCMPRICGYGFNPLSIYYCYDRGDELVALIYEVHNTFGERHSYLIAVDRGGSGVLEQHCLKRFYVSPFMDMDIAYHFRIIDPAQRISAVIQCSNAQGPVIVASLSGQRRALTDAALLRVFFTHPLLTMKVIGGIHWEALRLWLKGLRLRPRPPAPRALTIVRQSGTEHG
jgi:uncharacterized protein